MPLGHLLRLFRSSPQPAPRRRSHRPGFESLERRDLPASFNLFTGQMGIIENANENLSRVTIQNQSGILSVTEVRDGRSTTSQWPAIMVWGITIQAGWGEDSITLQNLPSWTAVSVDGGTGWEDRLTVERSSATTWNITDNNAGNVYGMVQFTSIERLNGDGSGQHRFVFSDGKTIRGDINGGSSSTDTVDYSASTWGRTVSAGRFSNIETVIGGSGSDTLVGGWGLWSITGQNVIEYGARYTSFENIETGCIGARFFFSEGQGLSGSITASTLPCFGFDGLNILDYSDFSTPVTVDLYNRTADGLGGYFSGITDVVGGDAGDHLIGSGLWEITDHNVGQVTYLGRTTDFHSFENLTSGALSSRFVFSNGKGVSGSVTGSPGSWDLLDYSAYSTQVTVDLRNGTATGISAGQSGFEHVCGGSWADILVGDDANNILVGNAGNDLILGSSGRDVIIGGLGVDSLFGESGEDVLIDGTTVYDQNAGALSYIMSEWSRTDLNYRQRISNIRAGTGNTYGRKLDSTTVTSDTSVDTMSGGTSSDWFWAVANAFLMVSPNSSLARDTLTDWESGWSPGNSLALALLGEEIN